MFTGIIEEIGTLTKVISFGKGKRLQISGAKSLENIALGDSIAINGVCLTVVDWDDTSFTVEAVEETLKKSTFGSFETGMRVNLERALKVGGKLGGHFVLGHVDCTTELARIDQREESWLYRFRYPSEYRANIIPVGSIAVDGVSLTIAEKDDETFAVSIIPHTRETTLFHTYRPGSEVNIEFDMLGKYILNYLDINRGSDLDMSKLLEWGY
ncbi:MAG: riboflavin synthase [Ectothiorhodospiraceae bacterium]|nr:riboflavin synthase [Ectothiorhodospiraceae bacterium]